MQLEDLSNEIFYELFAYIQGERLYEAFYGLNNRFNNLLSDCRLIRHVKFIRLSHIQSIFNADEIQFINLRYSERNSNTLALDLQRSLIMPYASSLSVKEVFIADLIVGLYFIKSLMPNLVYITLSVYSLSSSISNHIQCVIEHLLDLLHLRRLSLHFPPSNKQSTSVHLSSKKQAQSLEHFAIVGRSFSLVSIIHLMANCPNLSSIKMELQKDGEQVDYSIFQQLRKATLKFLKFNSNDLKELFHSMTNIYRLRLQNDEFISLARFCLHRGVCITHLPKSFL